ncbi:acyl-CoA dehydrogenase family protein [Rhodococcus rhodochrous]|uniref:Acyl-CoA dehydrogenase/oxidase C-terminal domain-containing protein n=1 Tax=Rhodococcus rhodochrous KG-21 TaxID=1441923 RepID=A0A0M9WQV6_RHORH|nr:acyl-CoA dehydrogenase family protein [Rhodococcus rhodochrous]KOS58183.1 hypothetical protein Z051_01040 [Rhodococcus rhodochrous KG-21]
MDQHERTLLRESIEQALTAVAPESWTETLDDFGWHDLLEEDPQTAITEVADLQGALLPRSSIINDSVMGTLPLDESVRSTIPAPARFVFPPIGSMDPPGRTDAISDNCAVTVSGMVSTDSRPHGSLIIPATDGNTPVLLVITGPDELASLSGTPTAIEPDSGWVHISGSAIGTVVARGDAAVRLWTCAVRTAQLVLAQELTTLGRRMLELTVEHVASRKQFGRPIGSFQSVKHGLADTRVEQETAELAIEAAWEQSDPEAAALAKLLAGKFFRSAAQHCQQYLGGMGFTWEHPFHTFLRRGMILEQILGTTTVLRTQLGTAVRTGTIPVIGVL